ncbi:hypothetical protein D3C78_1202620 [compost metagenome]
MPGNDQQRDHAAQLTLAEHAALFLDLRQRRHQVIARLRSTLVDQRKHVAREFVVAMPQLTQVVPHLLDDHVGPTAEIVAVLCGNAKQLGDDGDR